MTDSMKDATAPSSAPKGVPALASAVPAVKAAPKREWSWIKMVPSFRNIEKKSPEGKTENGNDPFVGSTGGEQVRAKALKLDLPDMPGALAGSKVKIAGVVEGVLDKDGIFEGDFAVKGDFKLEVEWPEGLAGKLGGGLAKLEFLA